MIIYVILNEDNIFKNNNNINIIYHKSLNSAKPPVKIKNRLIQEILYDHQIFMKLK